MEIIQITGDQVGEVAVLFDKYRQFYELKSDITLATKYLRDRVENGESIVFAARDENGYHGFTQVYTTFCSLEAQKIYVLYDLYVDAASRKNGIGRMLMNAVADKALAEGIARIDLSTAKENTKGQGLYEQLGYERDNVFYSYSLSIDHPPLSTNSA